MALNAVWRRLLPFLPARWWLRLATISLLSLLAGLLEAGLLVLIVTGAVAIVEGVDGVAMEIPILGTADFTTGSAVVFALAAGLSLLVFHGVVGHLSALTSSEVLTNTRARLIRAYANATWDRQVKEREGSLQESVSTLALRSADLTLHLVNLVAALLSLAVMLGAALVLEPRATAAIVVGAAALIAVLSPVRNATHRRARVWVDRHSRLAERISEWTGLALEHRVFGVERQRADALHGESVEVSSAFRRSRFMTRLGSSLFKDLAVVFLALAVLLLTAVEDVRLASVGAVVLLVVRSLAYAQAAQVAVQTVNEHAPSLDLLVERLGSLEESEQARGGEAVSSVTRIRLEGVSYFYDREVPALHEISLEVVRGEALGIIGPSGGGKSTLLRMLLGVATPTSGTVWVDGTDLRYLDPEAWSQLVSYVPQDPLLFEGSIADNIAFGRSWIDTGAIRDAASAACILDEVLQLPEGLDTRLGPRGTGLSGGQRQRVALARALAGRPSVLILDEPTSALDARSEELVFESLSAVREDVALVLVAHGLSNLRLCSRVAAVSGGELLVVGGLDDAIAALDRSTRNLASPFGPPPVESTGP